jgi:hypothetical protein
VWPVRLGAGRVEADGREAQGGGEQVTAWNYNGWFGVDRQIHLSPGVYDEDARDVFMRGHCHSLALALMELIPDATLFGAWEDGELAHVFVGLSDGDFLDGTGITTEERILQGLGSDAFIEMLDYEDLEWTEERGHFRRSRAEDAKPFARALIEREGIETRMLTIA